MNNLEQTIKNLFLVFVACALFALPVFVYINLVPVVDTSLSQISLTNQDYANREKNYDEVEDKITQVVKNDNQNKSNILGVSNNSTFGIENFFDPNIVVNQEILINEENAYFSVVSLASEMLVQNKMLDLYLINDNPEYSELKLEFGLMEDNFNGLIISAILNDNEYLIYDGNRLTKESSIKLNSQEMLVLGFKIDGEAKNVGLEKNISVKLDRL